MKSLLALLFSFIMSGIAAADSTIYVGTWDGSYKAHAGIIKTELTIKEDGTASGKNSNSRGVSFNRGQGLWRVNNENQLFVFFDYSKLIAEIKNEKLIISTSNKEHFSLDQKNDNDFDDFIGVWKGTKTYSYKNESTIKPVEVVFHEGGFCTFKVGNHFTVGAWTKGINDKIDIYQGVKITATIINNKALFTDNAGEPLNMVKRQ